MNKADRLTKMDLEILGYHFQHELNALRAQKSHTTRWVNEYSARAAHHDRIINHIGEGTDEISVVNRDHHTDARQRMMESAARHARSLEAINSQIAELVATGKRIIAEGGRY